MRALRLAAAVLGLSVLSMIGASAAQAAPESSSPVVVVAYGWHW